MIASSRSFFGIPWDSGGAKLKGWEANWNLMRNLQPRLMDLCLSCVASIKRCLHGEEAVQAVMIWSIAKPYFIICWGSFSDILGYWLSCTTILCRRYQMTSLFELCGIHKKMFAWCRSSSGHDLVHCWARDNDEYKILIFKCKITLILIQGWEIISMFFAIEIVWCSMHKANCCDDMITRYWRINNIMSGGPIGCWWWWR